MKLLMMLLILGPCLFLSKVEARNRLVNCGANGSREIEDALRFLDQNIGHILNDSTISDLTRREERRLKRKLRNLNLKCFDGRRVCRDARRLGVHRHPFRTAAVICYNNLRDIYGNSAFCKLAGTILHEMSHAAGVKKSKDHNDPDGPKNDRVYRVGKAARAKCRSLGKDGPISAK